MSVNQDYTLYHTTTPHHHHHLPPLDSTPHFQSLNLNHPNNKDPHQTLQNLNINNEKHQRETMFEKPLTPSDVGKLNRLVIPKQHAERHFPLNTLSNGADSSGMLLSFEDEDGKFWRFQYSYWNSSQSYVLTKGWSRYVKEKRLDAGDVVVFERHVADLDRMFIGWRRRNEPLQTTAVGGSLSYPAQKRTEASAGVVNQSRTASLNGSTSSRTLRLFGVDMEYQFESDQSEPATPDGSSTSSSNGQHQHYNHFFPQANYYGISNHHMQDYASHNQHRG